MEVLLGSGLLVIVLLALGIMWLILPIVLILRLNEIIELLKLSLRGRYGEGCGQFGDKVKEV